MVISKRKNIHVKTLKKVEDFLKQQTKPIFKSDIVKQIGVDYDSLGVALDMLEITHYKDGRVELKC